MNKKKITIKKIELNIKYNSYLNIVRRISASKWSKNVVAKLPCGCYKKLDLLGEEEFYAKINFIF